MLVRRRAVSPAFTVAMGTVKLTDTGQNSCVIDGTTRYVGITEDIIKRGYAHMRATHGPPPRCKVQLDDGVNSLHKRIRHVGALASAKMKTRVLILIKGSASKAILRRRFSGRRSTVRPSSFYHSQFIALGGVSRHARVLYALGCHRHALVASLVVEQDPHGLRHLCRLCDDSDIGISC